MVDLGGGQGTTHDAAGLCQQDRANGLSKAETAARDPCGGLPPGVIRQVATERGADGGADFPTKGSPQIVVQDISMDAHVVHELRHVGTLSGEPHFSGGVVNAWNGPAHLVAGACVDLLMGAKSGHLRSGAQALAEDRDSVVNVRGVPAQTLACALAWTEEPSGALCVAMRGTATGGPEEGHGGAGREATHQRRRPDEDLPVISKPLVADTSVLEMRGVAVPRVGFPRIPQDRGALDGAKHVTLLSFRVGGKHGSRGESDD